MARSLTLVHWLSAAIVAALLIVIVPMVTSGATSPYKVTNSRSGVAVFKATNVKPGGSGSGVVRIRNAGRKPVTVSISQDRVTNTGFGTSLRLQVHDDTANRCYYPKRVRGKCPTWGLWRAGSRLTKVPVLSRRGAQRWPAGERHTMRVRWTLLQASANTDQGNTATFRLVWRSTT